MSAEFLKEMKRTHTIIAPDMFHTHMELIQAIFRLSGYRVEVVHYEGKQVIDTGLRYLHNDVCYPAICALGQQIYALTCGTTTPIPAPSSCSRPGAAAGPPTTSCSCARP